MKKITIPLFLLLAVCLTIPALASETQLSPALDVLAAENDMILSAMRHTTLSLCEDDFRNALGDAVRSVTVLSVPPRSEGVLTLGGSDVQPGEVIPIAETSRLSFIPANDTVLASSFTFTTDHQYETVCTMRFTEAVNVPPTAAGKEVTVWTQKNVSESGLLAPFIDADGDALRYEIVSYPAHGTAWLTDAASGAYRYTPTAGFVGEDSFTYRVRDEYGHYSAVRTASVSAVKPLSTVVFADVADGEGQNAALVMAAREIMTCRVVGGAVYFDPESPVTREAFLVDVLKLFGTGTAAPCEKTEFDDDGLISAAAKPYVNAAYRLGLVSGSGENASLLFRPNDAITRGEAAAILSRLIGKEADGAVPAFADDGDLPLWAKSAVYAMREWGILMPDADGRFAADAVLSRGDEAEAMLRLLLLSGRL